MVMELFQLVAANQLANFNHRYQVYDETVAKQIFTNFVDFFKNYQISLINEPDSPLFYHPINLYQLLKQLLPEEAHLRWTVVAFINDQFQIYPVDNQDMIDFDQPLSKWITQIVLEIYQKFTHQKWAVLNPDEQNPILYHQNQPDRFLVALNNGFTNDYQQLLLQFNQALAPLAKIISCQNIQSPCWLINDRNIYQNFKDLKKRDEELIKAALFYLNHFTKPFDEDLIINQIESHPQFFQDYLLTINDHHYIRIKQAELNQIGISQTIKTLAKQITNRILPHLKTPKSFNNYS